LNASARELRAVLIAPPTSLERYSGFFARKLGIPETVRRAMQERFERALGKPWKDFELPQSVAQVRASALVIHDTDDAEVPSAAGVALARAWPGARFVGTQGLGHRGVLRDPEVARDVVDFMGARVVFPPPPASPRARVYGAPAPIL
jgi:pimeloyl-ACP methyl ester carboxylesterase